MNDPTLQKLATLDYTPPRARGRRSIGRALRNGAFGGLQFRFVCGPAHLHSNHNNDGQEKTGKLGMPGPEHAGEINLPGPKASRGSDQTSYQGYFESPHRSPFIFNLCIRWKSSAGSIS
jgi:hypothetical protein